jgi:hypothetical protein
VRKLPAAGSLIALAATAALAQSRGPVLPNFSEPQKQVPAQPAESPAEAQAKVEADARAVPAEVSIAEAEKRARAAAEDAHQKALELVLARRRAAEAAAAAKKRAHEEAAAKAESAARAKALITARKHDEAKCKGKRSRSCLDAVAARYDAPALPLVGLSPTAPAVASPPGALALAPLVPLQARPDAAVQAPQRAASIPAAAISPAPASMNSVEDTEYQQKTRAAEVRNDLQVGPDALLLDHLAARAEAFPGSLQIDLGYRFAIDDARAFHHLFALGVESARCGDCKLSWFVRGGLGPNSNANYGVVRQVNGTNGTHTDNLAWSANLIQAGAGWAQDGWWTQADTQLEWLSESYLRNVDLGGAPGTSASILQARLRASGGLSNGPWSGELRFAGYLYSGDSTAQFASLPMRGALIEDDLPGLAGALQSLSLRAQGRWETQGGFSVTAGAGYLGYVGPSWSGGYIVNGGVAQKFGRYRAGLGVVYENESDSSGNTYPTVFVTATVGATF